MLLYFFSQMYEFFKTSAIILKRISSKQNRVTVLNVPATSAGEYILHNRRSTIHILSN